MALPSPTSPAPAPPTVSAPPGPVERTPPWLHIGQGLLMGGADIIPGVSGGTMALIVGIYERLIRAISAGVSVLLLLLRGRVREAFRAFLGLDWRLLLPLALGIGTAIALGSLFIPHLLATYPVACRALFFGLVAASLAIPWQERQTRRAWHYAVAAAAAVVAFLLVGLPRGAAAADPSMLRVGLTAAVAINAMILPGVSGAFLLEVFGLYTPTLEALRSLDIGYIAVFTLGAGLGLGAAAKALAWLLAHAHDLTMAVLVGLLAGSLRALWPWVPGIEHVGSDGAAEYAPDPSVLLAPGPDWPLALALGLLGFAFVSALAWVGRRRALPARVGPRA